MSRPESHADLTDYTCKGHVVATIPADYITRYPSLGQHLLAALAEASRLGLVIDDADIVIPPTDAELDEALVASQRGWDGSQRWYDDAASGVVVEQWKRYSITSHAKSEGLPVPEFDEDGIAIFGVEQVSL